MQNQERKTRKTKNFIRTATVFVLLVSLMLQTVAFCCFAIGDFGTTGSVGSGSSSGGVSNGLGSFDEQQIIAQLKDDFLKSVNQNLIAKVEEYELSGPVGVILTFSDEALLDKYHASGKDDKITFAEYSETSAAQSYRKTLANKQSSILESLMADGLITKVEHTYDSLLDGAFVRTTYENLSEIAEYADVKRITLSNTYEALEAVENSVNVYETGIFNSGDVTYTGKGTVVAVIDFGCDYTHTAFTTHTVVDPKYSRDYIESVLPGLIAYSYDNSLEARDVYYGNVTGGKIVFGYDYADKDPNILPYSNSHGTHVAGIIGGKDDTITGVAIDTQLAIMKVFSDYKDGAEDGDILAALEDCVTLGVDAINMSLGSSCGFVMEYDPDNDYKNELYSRIEAEGISLIVAAANDHSSGYGAEDGSTSKTDNPDSATVGSPGTYSAALTVASISGKKQKYMSANGTIVFFDEAVNQNAKEYDFFDMLGVNKDNPVKEIEYVTVPGYGYAVNYAGIDVEGKIALVKRGDITFEEKVRFAYEAGAAAIIIYNNVSGKITMTVGNELKIPVVSINKDEGDILAKEESGVLSFNYENKAGPFMSDFSSWGPTPNLELKPEITAHGGNILSAIAGGKYDELSGTSMASPNMCGIAVLIRQYIQEKFENDELTATEARDLVNQLSMSTATIALDQKGNPYSPRKQGAGIADLKKSTTTGAYLFVTDANGIDIGKTKLELGDDPDRLGVYEMKINLRNFSDSALSYTLGNIVMTETVSSSDPEYVAEMAYILSNTSEYSAVGGTITDGVLTVAAGATATVTVKITLSAEDKAYLNSSFKNGMYVEGFLTFDNTDANGVDLNAPFLAFFGDWGEAPIFDLDYYEVETEAHNDAIDDEDKIKADYYATTPLGLYYYDYLIPLGSYLYDLKGTDYNPIPATREHAAVSYFANGLSGIYGVFSGLLRGAKELNISIVDTSTGKEVWSETKYNCYKAHFSGQPYPYIAKMDVAMWDTETGKLFGNNNVQYEVTLSAKLDWDSGDRNSSDTYKFSFYVDYEAPTITDVVFRTKYDKSREENRYYADVYVYDNHYAMSIRPVLVQTVKDSMGRDRTHYANLMSTPVPVYQENKGENTKVTIEITDFLDVITASESPEGIIFYVDDYALNASAAFVPFPDVESGDVQFQNDGKLSLDIGGAYDLKTYLEHKTSEEEVYGDYLAGLSWTSSDEDVVAISRDGRIQALKTGVSVISLKASEWKEPVQLTVTVSDKTLENPDPNSSEKIALESLEFISYETLKAFNSDVSPSEIGLTGSVNYFGGNHSISFYPSEKVKLNYSIQPLNIDKSRYTLEWITSNPRVVTVDENGVVEAQAEGSARVTLKITIDGKVSLIAARCSFEVKSEFIIESRQLIAYKGWGGDVVIPDDEGIIYISKYAFAHYAMDNEKYVEKDENGYYDIDLKKKALGNDTITSVIVPAGVEKIEKYAFYNCTMLKSVTLPEDCETIDSYAFAECKRLESINFENVNVVCDYAFYNCTDLANASDAIGLSKVYAIGTSAFENTGFKTLDLSNLSLVMPNAFANCSRLKSVTLGAKTRPSNGMFMGSSLESVVVFADTVGNSAFENCKKLTSAEFKNDLTFLGDKAFKNCNLLSTVTFGGICEEIGNEAFASCTAISTFTLPGGKVVLGDKIFENSGLDNLVFASTTEIVNSGVALFSGVGSVEITINGSIYENVGGVIYNKEKTVLVLAVPGAAIGSVTIPATVEVIMDGAFSGCHGIFSVSFESGSNLKTIGDAAFAFCANLSTFTLPDAVVALGDYAFYNTISLENINLEKVSRVGKLAFSGSHIKGANLIYDGVVIDSEAFIPVHFSVERAFNPNAVDPNPALTMSGFSLETRSFLTSLTLGSNAKVGYAAFAFVPLATVTIDGTGVYAGDYSFAFCSNMTSFDFEGLGGEIGDFAFCYCLGLKSVNAPEVTKVGNNAFADCYQISTLSMPKVTEVGNYAFGAYTTNVPSGATFATVNLPKLEKIGSYAFFFCNELTSIDLSLVTAMGEAAFAKCSNLETVTVTDKLTVLPKYAFADCVKLTDFDLSNVVRFEDYSFRYATLPANLVLTKAEYIGEAAFCESTANQNLVSVEAPALKEIGSIAFVGCKKLTTFHAPVLETIGNSAFAATAIAEFEIFPSFKRVNGAAFEQCENFTGFYYTEGGKKLYDKELDNVVIADGVLYSKGINGLALIYYPEGKEGDTLTVLDGTVRIDSFAAFANKNLKKVVLPESLKFVAPYAFYGCENLKTVVFKSYYAPTLESSLDNEMPDINVSNLSSYPGFEDLYKYNYYFKKEGSINLPHNYKNFVGVVGSKASEGITYIIPEESDGYDSLIYLAYFEPSEENSGKSMGPEAVRFIESVKKLPGVLTRYDEEVMMNAITAYNALADKPSELALVDSSYVSKYEAAYSEYFVDVTENKIDHLFDMANGEYFFNLVKDAKESYDALSDSDKALVSNKDKLTAKIAELAVAMGIEEVDFTKTYAENLPEIPEENEDPGVEDPNKEFDPVILIVIIAASVLVLAGAGVVAFIFLKKKKVTSAADSSESGSNEED